MASTGQTSVQAVFFRAELSNYVRHGFLLKIKLVKIYILIVAYFINFICDMGSQ